LSARRATLSELLLVYLVAVTAFGYFAGTWQDGNTYSRLSLVMALTQEHRFEIDTPQLAEEWRQFRTADRSIYNGHYYSDKAIGSSLIGAMAWAPLHAVLQSTGTTTELRVFKVMATFLGTSLVCALLAPMVYWFVTGVAGSRQALLVTSAVVFGTSTFKYSTGFYGHVPAALCLLGGALIWFRAKQRRHLSLVQVFASCALAGFMVVTEYPTAVLALVLGGYMLLVLGDLGRLRDWRVYLVGAAAVALAISPLLYYNLAVYGHPLTTGYQHHATVKFAAAHSQGLSGIGPPDVVVMFAMTLHPLMGIFWQSPVLLLAIPGWFAMWRAAHRMEASFSFAAILVYVALISGYYEWSGGLAYTPRHLIPMLPLFAMPLAFLPRRWMPLAWGLTALSIVQHTVAVAGRADWVVRLIRSTLDASGHPSMHFTSTIWTVIWPNMQRGMFLKNRGTMLLPDGFLSLLPLAVLEAALVFLLARRAAQADRTDDGVRLASSTHRP
jgi:hypothetical protein